MWLSNHVLISESPFIIHHSMWICKGENEYSWSCDGVWVHSSQTLASECHLLPNMLRYVYRPSQQPYDMPGLFLWGTTLIRASRETHWYVHNHILLMFVGLWRGLVVVVVVAVAVVHAWSWVDTDISRETAHDIEGGRGWLMGHITSHNRHATRNTKYH